MHIQLKEVVVLIGVGKTGMYWWRKQQLKETISVVGVIGGNFSPVYCVFSVERVH